VRPIALTVAGPLLGGILIKLGTGWVFIVDGLTFAVSTICAAMIRARSVRDVAQHLLRDIREGIASVRRTRWIQELGDLHSSSGRWFWAGPRDLDGHPQRLNADDRVAGHRVVWLARERSLRRRPLPPSQRTTLAVRPA
jgi:hypothetical protein